MRISVRGILLLVAMLHSIYSYAQSHGGFSLDSMLLELPKQKEDTNKVNLLVNLSYSYCDFNQDTGIKFGLSGLALAKKLGWKKGMADAYNRIGCNYDNKPDGPKALNCYYQAITLYEELDNKKGIAAVTGNIANVYYMQHNFAKALEYSFKSLEMSERIGDKRMVLFNVINIGNAYGNNDDCENALKYFFRALKLIEGSNDPNIFATIYVAIGGVYDQQKKHRLALEYRLKALNKINEIKEYLGLLQVILIGLGESYYAMSLDTPAGTQSVKGASELRQKAIYYGIRSLEVAKEIGAPRLMEDSYSFLSRIYVLEGDYKKAFEFTNKGRAVYDSIFNIENHTKITDLETKRSIDLKEKDIEIKDKQIALDRLAVAKKRNERGYFMAGLGLLGCVIVVVYKSYKTQQRNNKLLTKANSQISMEKKRSDDLLLNILPSEVAEELKEKGSADARLFEEVTVIFTDFVSFTEVSEKLSPRDLVRELDTCFKAFDEITSKFNIEKIKTIGDAYLAVCGLPLPNTQHSENVVMAALEINAFMQKRVSIMGNNTFRVRIGIHTGSVVAGIVGVKKFAYDIWGDTVNTAARMEQNSVAGKINISETTYELVKDKFSCEYRGEVEAKGKGVMKMYFVG
ncbi:MAG: hypothetical protein K9G49_08050 [Taibaiella sp.]|nr:hypothetical protein [Taibaiella sp.]